MQKKKTWAATGGLFGGYRVQVLLVDLSLGGWTGDLLDDGLAFAGAAPLVTGAGAGRLRSVNAAVSKEACDRPWQGNGVVAEGPVSSRRGNFGKGMAGSLGLGWRRSGDKSPMILRNRSEFEALGSLSGLFRELSNP